jgi:hypothetical protein
MSLAGWQNALVELVTHGNGPAVDADDLTEAERAWFALAVDHPGTSVTRDVVQSWRWRRVALAAPLTLLMLRRCGLLDSARTTYLGDTFAPSSYSLAEGRQLLDLVDSRWASFADGGNPADREHLSTIIALERAVLAAKASTWTTNIRASRPDDAISPGVGGLVRAGCDVRELMRCLLSGAELPRGGSGHGAFLVAPGIAGCFREATAGEIRALTLVGGGCPVSEVAGLWPNDLIDVVTLTRLESVGALVRQPPAPARPRAPQIVCGSPS